MATVRFTARFVEEPDGTDWAGVKESPGCFASGHDFDGLKETLVEAIRLCLPDGVELSEPSVERLGEARILVTG